MKRKSIRARLAAGCVALLATQLQLLNIAAAAEPDAKCGTTECSSSKDAHGHDEGEGEEGHDHGDEKAHGAAKERGGEEKGHGHEEGGHGDEEETLKLSQEVMKEFGIRIATAAPQKLNVTLTLTGKLVPHEDRVAHVTSRYPGVIRDVRKRLGDPVARGETVVVVENNQTLQPFEVKSQIPGIIVRRHAIIGESVSDTSSLFDIADYSELFVDFFVFPADHSKVRLGQRVLVRIQGQPTVESTISFLSPITDTDTQSRFVRAVLANPAGAYQAGMFVTGDVVLEERNAAVAVDNSALRTNEGKPAVFVEEEPGHFEARAVFTGRKDKDNTEILSGLKAGERYAAGNTFILQAEKEKGEAEHAH